MKQPTLPDTPSTEFPQSFDAGSENRWLAMVAALANWQPFLDIESALQGRIKPANTQSNQPRSLKNG